MLDVERLAFNWHVFFSLPDAGASRVVCVGVLFGAGSGGELFCRHRRKAVVWPHFCLVKDYPTRAISGSGIVLARDSNTPVFGGESSKTRIARAREF